MVAFGFARGNSATPGTTPTTRAARKEKAAKRPLVTIESRTEGIYFELDPAGCGRGATRTDGRKRTRTSDEAKSARAWLVCHHLPETRAPSPSPSSGSPTRGRTPSFTPSRDGRPFGPSSVAEYLFERLGAFLLYVANYSTPQPRGADDRHRAAPGRLARRRREQTTCVHDPICLTEQGGCHKCLALAFRLRTIQPWVARGYLLGSEDPAVREGWLVRAATHAVAQ